MKQLLFSLFLMNAVHSLGQTTYYVSPTGNDNANGTSLATPWQTMQKACTTAVAGSTVYFRGGTYPSTFVVMTVSGTPGNYITFKNYQNEVPVIDGNNTLQTLLRITDLSYLIIDGLHFTRVAGNGSRGVAIEGTSHHIQIQNCKISEINVSTVPGYMPATCDDNVSPLKFCGSNAGLAMTDIVIANNEVFSCKTGCSEGICVSGNVDNFVIENNSVHDIANIGIVAAGFYDSCAEGQARNGRIAGNVVYNCRFPNPAINTSASGIYVDGGKNIVVEQNRVYRCQVGIHAGCEHIGQTADNITIRNNIVYDNEKWGIGMGGEKGFTENSRMVNNTLFYNNYFYNGSYYGDFGEICLQKVRNSSVNNNSCFVRFQASNAVFMKWEYPSFLSGITINHNNYFSPDACNSSLVLVRNDSPNATLHTFSAYQGFGYDANGTTVNPQFVYPALPHPDVHVMASSPLINSGDNALTTVGTVDFDGNARKTAAIDKGAYEYQACPPYYKLYSLSPPGSAEYQVSQTISSTGQVLSGSNMTYGAAKSVELKPNFKADKGSVFLAKTAGCPVANWSVVFNDDFNACGNLSQWTAANRDDYNSDSPPSIQCTYVPTNPVIGQLDNRSCLLITATKKAGNSYQYESGHVKSGFTFTPAVNEEYHLSASIKLLAKSGDTFKGFAQTYGAWPAFWTVKEDGFWPTKGEIDIMEAYSKGSDAAPYANYASDIHYGTVSGTSTVNAKVSYDAIGEGWHTYEAFWRNQNGAVSVTIKVDGSTKVVYTNASHPNLQLQNFGNHSVIFNLNVGSKHAGIFNNALINLYSQTMLYVDYVTVRKRSI